MKIAMIGHKRVPSRCGGIEIVVEKLTDYLIENGFEVDLYNRYTKGTKKVTSYHGARVIEVPTSKKSSLNAMIYSFLAVFRAIFTRADVIHFHAEGPCVTMPIARLFGKRCVATVHGLDWKRAKWGGFATWYIRLGEKAAVKFAHEIIVLSLDTQVYFQEQYGRKTIFIPNGIITKPKQEANIITRNYGLTKNSYLLFLARITPEKGLDYLLDAYRQITTDKRLIIAGALHPETDYIQSLKQKIEEIEGAQLIGFVKGKELEELFSNCFLYILPSDIEGMPLSLLEAIGFGARCLVSDIPENVGVASEYVHTFPRGNVEDLKKTLELLISNENSHGVNFGKCETKEEVQAQLEEISGRYKWSTIGKRTAALYHK